MTATLFLYLLFFQVPGAVSDPSGQPAEGAKVACGSETKTSDPHEVSDFPSVCKTSDRVVVTATRAPLAVEESGVAASVFTAKDFEPVRGAFVQNLLRDVPGLTVVQTGPQRRDHVGVRARRRIGLGAGAAGRHSSNRARRRARLRAPDVSRIGAHGSDPRAGERAVRSRSVQRRDPDVHGAWRSRGSAAARISCLRTGIFFDRPLDGGT